MTTIYFIRHAEADRTVHDPYTRPLTEKGLRDRALVTAFLNDKNIDAIFSSPFKRAVDTIADFANHIGQRVTVMDSLKEHDTIGDNYPSDEYFLFIKKYWEDFHHKAPGDESLSEVQERNISAIKSILIGYRDKSVVIGTHGIALSTIINFYDSTYCFDDFLAMVKIRPWVVKMDFNDDGCVGMEKIDLLNPGQKPDYDNCIVRTTEFGALRAYRFTVVFARYKGKWLYCRSKDRDGFETAGGHIEPGESPLEGAKRELYEETGATEYEITPAFDYTVHVQTEYSNGQVYIAHISELGSIPDFEMTEVKLFDKIPDKMRFPKRLPILFEKVNELL